MIVKYRRFKNTTFLRCIDKDREIIVKLDTIGKPTRFYLKTLCKYLFSRME